MKIVAHPMPEGYTGTPTVTVCINLRPAGTLVMPSCGARGSAAIAAALESGLRERGLAVRFSTIRCLGLCDKGPNLRVAPSNSWIHGMEPADIPAILDWLQSHLAPNHAQAPGCPARGCRD